MAGLTTYFVANVAPGHASFKPSYALPHNLGYTAG